MLCGESSRLPRRPSLDVVTDFELLSLQNYKQDKLLYSINFSVCDFQLEEQKTDQDPLVIALCDPDQRSQLNCTWTTKMDITSTVMSCCICVHWLYRNEKRMQGVFKHFDVPLQFSSHRKGLRLLLCDVVCFWHHTRTGTARGIKGNFWL